MYFYNIIDIADLSYRHVLRGGKSGHQRVS